MSNPASNKAPPDQVHAGGRIEELAVQLAEERDRSRASEQRLAAVLDHLPVGVNLLDIQCRIVLQNSTGRRFAPELMPYRDARHWSAWKADGTPLEAADWPGPRALRGERVFPGIEALFTDDEGRKSWTSIAATPMRDAAGVVIGAIVVIEDIDQRKRAEEALRESEQQLRAIYNGTHEYLGLLSPDGILLEANRASLAFAGSKREEVVGLPFWDAVWFQFTPGAPEAVRDAVTRAAAGEFVQFEALIITPSGEPKTYDITFDPICNEAGEVVLIVPEGRDITEQKKGERALRESEERFRKLFEHAATGIAISDYEGIFEQCNPSYCALLGYREEELRQLHFSSLLHPEDREENMAQMRRLKEGEFDYFEIENRYVRKDGGSVWVHKYVSRLCGESGRTVHFMAMVTDVTERRRSEFALKEAKEAAEAANQSKDRFLAVLSHELRTPLTPVLMTAAALHSDESLPPDIREQLGMVERNVALEARLIDDLLDLTRITSGKLAMRAEPCDVHSLIALVVEMVRSEALEKEIAFQLDLSARRSFLTGDPARLQQVIWNLLRNAAKFTPSRGVVRVRTFDGSCETGDASGPRICIEVRDNGVGFDPAMAGRIFEPFEQSGSGRQFGGLGLGLAIARAIVDMHKGAITGTSPGPGQGATFIVELPGALLPNFEPPRRSQDGGEGNAQQGEAPLRILLVEDHEPTLQVLARLLSRAGHQVVGAKSIAEARAAAMTTSFDAVVSDLGLPDGTGVELMKHLRATHGLRGIALTGYGTDEDLRLSHDAGFVAHLVKPVDINELRRALRKLPAA